MTLKPKFGDTVRGIHASEKNPQRDGFYVQTVRRTGKMNAGTFYRLTDGHGRFWEYPVESTEIIDRRTPAAQPTAFLRGYPIHHADGCWRFVDTGEPTHETWKDRPCGVCGLHDTPEGHDGCLGTIPGMMNACCGHGIADQAFAQPTAPEAVREDSQAIVMRFIDEATSAIVAGIPLNEDEWAARLAAALAQPAREPVPVAWEITSEWDDGKVTKNVYRMMDQVREQIDSAKAHGYRTVKVQALFTHPSTEPDTLREIRNVIAEPLDPRIDLTNEWEDRLDRVDLIARTALSQGDTTP